MIDTLPKTGTLFIVSAPSGAGKTSLVKALVRADTSLDISISHTTRARRPSEIHGKDYYFVKEAEFAAMRSAGAFLEHAAVFDHHYGTSHSSVDQILSKGVDAILEIDWQGAEQIRQNYADAVSIFILPPSASELDARLRLRGQDNEQIISRRMQDAVREMSHYAEYDYIVVNDDFNHALNDLQAIVSARRCRREAQQIRLAQLIKDLLNA